LGTSKNLFIKERKVDSFISYFFLIFDMKWGIFLVLVVILLSPVSAELSFSCEKDADCFLFTGKQGLCVTDICDFGNLEPEELFFMVNGDVEWDTFVVSEKNSYGLNLEFAPEENNIWDFIFDARSWLL
jgi:hypothetical protein